MPRSDEVIRRLKADGWVLIRVKGSHHIFGKPGSPTIVVVPHPKKDLPKGTLRDIYRQAGWKWPPR